MYELLIPGLEGRLALDGGSGRGKYINSDDDSNDDQEGEPNRSNEALESGDGEDAGVQVDRRGRRRHHYHRSSRRPHRHHRHHTPGRISSRRPSAAAMSTGAMAAAADTVDENGELDVLTSANACRWILSPADITVGEPLGPMVHRGRWKGIDVVVKRFGQHPRTVPERELLDFRAEVALLSNLHHPNVVLFIGTRVHALFCHGLQANRFVRVRVR